MIDEEELELPAVDGENEEKPANPDPDDDTAPVLREDDGEGRDDAEQGGSLVDIAAELDVGEDQKWLEGSEESEHVHHDDSPLEETGVSLLGDEDAPGVEGEDFGLADSEATQLDAGEEGFEGEDDLTTPAELPNLDADEEGEIEDDLGFEPASETLPPWDDRAWDKVAGPLGVGAVTQLWLEAGNVVALTIDGVVVVDPSGAIVRRAERPVTIPEPIKKRIPAIEGATAEASYASGAVAAIHSETQERTWLVRTGQADPRIVADVTDDAGDVDAAPVSALVVEPTRGWVWVGGIFGLLAYRPPKRRD